MSPHRSPLPADPTEAARIKARARRRKRGWLRVRDRAAFYLRDLGLDDVPPAPEQPWPEREHPPIIHRRPA